ncbi:MAG TPA: UDP-3-O-(3-hydroxymyristoyl)glucosamine N-acyltransferase [Rhodospirillales bacterium]|nr:UDP-3-O-(3-hydroxymyristoyl)glucosamine N-acyltransferase [Rhodospirillales bacterium]
MADPRFYSVAGPFTLKEISEISGAKIAGDTAPETLFTDVAPLDRATEDHVSFLDNRLYTDRFSRSEAGACLVAPAFADKAPVGMALLLMDEPYRGYAVVVRSFHPQAKPEPGVAPTASVDVTAKLGAGCQIDASAVIGPRAEIGGGCHIGANAVIGEGVVIADDCVVAAGASLAFCIIGARVIIHPGVRIGQDGFGFTLGAEGHLKVPQVGRVIIEDDVEIGANTTIDRGAAPDTVIGAGTKIDNLVQIAHNVRIGRGCVIVAQVGISGSTEIGDFVIIGGQAGLAGHLRVGSGARIAAQSGVMRDVADGVTVAGFPAKPAKEHWREQATLANLTKKKKG